MLRELVRRVYALRPVHLAQYAPLAFEAADRARDPVAENIVNCERGKRLPPPWPPWSSPPASTDRSWSGGSVLVHQATVLVSRHPVADRRGRQGRIQPAPEPVKREVSPRSVVVVQDGLVGSLRCSRCATPGSASTQAMFEAVTHSVRPAALSRDHYKIRARATTETSVLVRFRSTSPILFLGRTFLGDEHPARLSRLSLPTAAVAPHQPVATDLRAGRRPSGELTPATPTKQMLQGVGYGRVDQRAYPTCSRTATTARPTDTEHEVAVLENERAAGHVPARCRRSAGLARAPVPAAASCCFATRASNRPTSPCANAWFSGGVEWNIATIGHSPLTCEPLHAVRAQHADGSPVLRMYEYERLRGVVFSDRRVAAGGLPRAASYTCASSTRATRRSRSTGGRTSRCRSPPMCASWRPPTPRGSSATTRPSGASGCRPPAGIDRSYPDAQRRRRRLLLRRAGR